MSTTTWVIAERALTDDELIVPDQGYMLKGGYVAAVRFHTYAGPWSDDTHVRRFRTLETAARWIEDRYGDEADWDIIHDFTLIDRPAS